MVTHFHVLLTNNGVAARLPATATKELAVEAAVTWLGTRIAATGVVELYSHGRTVQTGFGVASLIECDCPEELLTKAKVKAIYEDEMEARIDAGEVVNDGIEKPTQV